MLGGNYDDGRPRIAERLDVRVPAKRIPDTVERFIRYYQANRQEGEEFNTFVDRVGLDAFEQLIKDLSVPVKYDDEHKHEFIDWNRTGLYKLERGEGECAA
jgi:dissimilatory sulfite reductase (desulfoviridin) alpha/beta subunit